MSERDHLAWALQSIVSRYWPEDYEESWPTKACYGIADSMLSGEFGRLAKLYEESAPKPRRGIFRSVPTPS